MCDMGALLGGFSFLVSMYYRYSGILCFAVYFQLRLWQDEAGRNFTTPTPYSQPNGACFRGPDRRRHHHTRNGKLWRTCMGVHRA